MLIVLLFTESGENKMGSLMHLFYFGLNNMQHCHYQAITAMLHVTK